MIIEAWITVTRDGREIEISITANVNGPEHDVGIMSSWTEGFSASLDGDQFDLTEEEEEKSEEILGQKYMDQASIDYDEN